MSLSFSLSSLFSSLFCLILSYSVCIFKIMLQIFDHHISFLRYVPSLSSLFSFLALFFSFCEVPRRYFTLFVYISAERHIRTFIFGRDHFYEILSFVFSFIAVIFRLRFPSLYSPPKRTTYPPPSLLLPRCIPLVLPPSFFVYYFCLWGPLLGLPIPFALALQGIPKLILHGITRYMMD